MYSSSQAIPSYSTNWCLVSSTDGITTPETSASGYLAGTHGAADSATKATPKTT